MHAYFVEGLRQPRKVSEEALREHRVILLLKTLVATYWAARGGREVEAEIPLHLYYDRYIVQEAIQRFNAQVPAPLHEAVIRGSVDRWIQDRIAVFVWKYAAIKFRQKE